MWLILQQPTAEDYVIATGITTTVRDFIRMAFEELGIDIEFKGKGINEKGYVSACKNKTYNLSIGKEIVAIDSNYFRPTEVDLLIGNASKARIQLGWKPTYDLSALVKEMVANDVALLKEGKKLVNDHLMD